MELKREKKVGEYIRGGAEFCFRLTPIITSLPQMNRLFLENKTKSCCNFFIDYNFEIQYSTILSKHLITKIYNKKWNVSTFERNNLKRGRIKE